MLEKYIELWLLEIAPHKLAKVPFFPAGRGVEAAQCAPSKVAVFARGLVEPVVVRSPETIVPQLFYGFSDISQNSSQIVVSNPSDNPLVFPFILRQPLFLH